MHRLWALRGARHPPPALPSERTGQPHRRAGSGVGGAEPADPGLGSTTGLTGGEKQEAMGKALAQ